MKVTVKTLAELNELAKKFAKSLKGNETFALIGELGAGKTAFTKALLKAAHINKKVSSPTFVLMIPYTKERKTFYHMDLYRLNSWKEAAALGLPELLGKKNNVFLIEWAEKIKTHLPKNTIYLIFKVKNNSYRELEIRNAPKHFKI